jgi:hypothetical protein
MTNAEAIAWATGLCNEHPRDEATTEALCLVLRLARFGVRVLDLVAEGHARELEFGAIERHGIEFNVDCEGAARAWLGAQLVDLVEAENRAGEPLSGGE